MSVQERVARGTRWLDRVQPGWRDALELGRLDLASGDDCVLGQVFAEEAKSRGHGLCGYSYALRDMLTPAERLDCPEWASAHGFESLQLSLVCRNPRDALAGLADVDDEIAALEAEWRRMIHVPRDEFASPVPTR
jgi:hypothetical protein